MNPLLPSTVRKAIQARYAKLSAQQKRAADYLIRHHRTAFAMSVSELAAAAQVSEATVVRFAREIGYAGYHELRNALMAEAKKDLSPEDRFAAESPSPDPAGTVAHVADLATRNIARTVEELDAKAFRRFAGHLRSAEMVATTGLGASSLLARIAHYQLFQIGIASQYLARDAVTLTEQVEILPVGAALWVFSFPPYSRQTVAAVAHAKKRQLVVLAITDSVRSPIDALATEVLHACSDNVLFTNSLSSALILIDAVITDAALSDKERALGHLHATASVSKDEYL